MDRETDGYGHTLPRARPDDPAGFHRDPHARCQARRLSGLLLTLLAVVLSGIGARDQATVAALAERQGQRLGLLAVALVCAMATAALAAWAGSTVLPMLVPKARVILAAMALGLAGGEQLLIGAPRKPEEPTRSLGAAGIVLLAHQVTDSARFLVFAVAVATAAPIPAGIGGAAGGALALGAAWLAPELFADPRIRILRRAVGGLLLAVAAIMALQALG